MNLISEVAAIIDQHNLLDKIGYIDIQSPYNNNLSILDIDWKNILPNPPKNSSVETYKELKILSALTNNRTIEEVNLIYTVDEDPLILFKTFLENKNLIFPTNKFDSYYNICEQYIYAIKSYFNRPRPEQLAKYYDDININVIYTNTINTPSYPSGHTAYATIAELILNDMYPEYKKDFSKLSEYCGFARMLQGVHYPSDNVAATQLANILYETINKQYKYNEKNQTFATNI